MSRESKIVDEAVDILSLARRLKLDWPERSGRPFQVHCPLHADTTPSARVYPGESNSGYCWTCQASFGPTALYVAVMGAGWTAAVHELAGLYGIDLTPDPDEAEARRLIGMAFDRPATRSPEDAADLRRAVSMQARGVGRSWPEVEGLLRAYELLDLTDVDPIEWLSSLTQAQPSA